MFGSGMLSFLVLLLAISVLARQTPLFLLSLALLVAALLSRLWERYCLTGVEYRRRFSHQRASFGDEVVMEIEIINRKILPLSWLEIEDEMPRDLPPKQGRVYASHKAERAVLPNFLPLKPYERVRRRYVLPCVTRGEHRFGPVRLRSGDLFGFISCERNIELPESLVVYPRVVPVAQLGLPSRYPVGELRTQSWIFEDVSRVAGAREYRPGDSLRRIHWAATARTGELQSRVYEATTSHRLALFLNLDTNETPGWGFGYDPDVLEFTITAAASLASWALERGYQIGVYTNGMHRWVRGAVSVEPARDSGQLERILVALGRLEPITALRFELLLDGRARKLPFGSTAVIITSTLRQPVVAAIRAVRHGTPTTVILTGRRPSQVTIPGVTIRRAGPPESWREIQSIAPTIDVAGPQGTING